MCEILYHYCTMEKFCAMMQNGTLRFSDITKSNDYEELKFLIHLYQKYVSKIVEAKGANSLYPNSIEWFLNGILEVETAYALCFSEGEDKLSQWRGYAEKNGIAIGFNKNKLQEYAQKICVACENKAKLVKIKYVPLDISEGSSLPKEQEDNYSEIQSFFEENFGENVSINDLSILLQLFDEYKNNGFDEEKEQRIVFHQFYRAQNSISQFPSICFQGEKIDVQFSNCCSYYDLPFPYEAVEKIIIGPNNKIKASSIHACFENSTQKHSLTKLGRDSISVTYTKLTYRS